MEQRLKPVMLAESPEHAELARPVIAGVDEAGRGPLAGPVVAAAVVLGKGAPQGLADSKKLSARRRAELDPQIRASCAWGVGIVEPEEIERLNIFGATMRAMTLAVVRLAEAMDEGPANVLVDGNHTPAGRDDGWCWAAQPIIGGDALEPAISAASIIAKEWRDRVMKEAAKVHPHYGWERNMGYGTKEHLEALRRHGPTPLHRKSFAPVAQLTLL